MNVAFIIPTGLGCEIGGHAGDAAPAARLIAETCDKLILHPNVVNASDINEMPDNALYVEGSMLDSFLEGKICLKEVRSNKVMVAVNKGFAPDVVNAISASRATLGVDAVIMTLDTPLIMEGWVENGKATGKHTGVEELISQFKDISGQFDALAIVTEIKVETDIALEYFKTGGVNPWGGIEAIVSGLISQELGCPAAHAPVESSDTKATPELLNLPYIDIVDPRMAAEVCAVGYSHCVLKGLQRAPRPAQSGIHRDTVGCLITPWGCSGRPHMACIEADIPVIVVRKNACCGGSIDQRFIYVENYIEAAGMVSLLKSGVTRESVTKINKTIIL